MQLCTCGSQRQLWEVCSLQGSDFGLQACIGGVFTHELPLGPQTNVFNFILRNNQTDLVLYLKIFHTFYSLL